MRIEELTEGVPNPAKLRKALMTFATVAKKRGYRDAMRAIADMGLSPSQANAVADAYTNYLDK